MRAVMRAEVTVAAPAASVWSYVTDWPRQGEWIPFTRVEEVDRGHQVGGRIRAWTGLGPVGFWDPMTITAWEESADGSARCEVLHTGSVLAGEGEFAVRTTGARSCTFSWWERLAVPGGPVAALAWRAGGPLSQRAVQYSLHRMVARVEGRAEPHGNGRGQG